MAIKVAHALVNVLKQFLQPPIFLTPPPLHQLARHNDLPTKSGYLLEQLNTCGHDSSSIPGQSVSIAAWFDEDFICTKSLSAKWLYLIATGGLEKLSEKHGRGFKGKSLSRLMSFGDFSLSF